MSKLILDEGAISELRDLFCQEAIDSLAHMEAVIMRYEDETEIRAEIARVLHSLKGGAHAASLSVFGLIVHDLEDIFAESHFEEHHKTLLLRIIDRLRETINLFLQKNSELFFSKLNEIRNFTGSVKYYLPS